MGAVLSQRDANGEDFPIAYASRSCNLAEQNYSSFDGECLAVVWANTHFKQYLFGTSFTLVTDHEPLRWILTTPKLTGKLTRWSFLLQEYDFVVVHRAGTENSNADCLSRHPLPPNGDPPILDWDRGDINLSPATHLAFVAVAGDGGQPELGVPEIWDDKQVISFVQTHQYGRGLSAK